jgi:uncharacterized membrane protein YgcG
MRATLVYQDLRTVTFARLSRLFLAVCLGVTLAPADLRAQIALPDPVGYVNDFADVIPAEQERQMSRIIDEVRARSGGEIVVVTLPSLAGALPRRGRAADRPGVGGGRGR